MSVILTVILTVLQIGYVSSVLYVYHCLFIRRHLFTDRFAMTVTITAATVFSLVFAFNLTLLLAMSINFTFLVGSMVGSLIGLLFGSLTKFHSILVGVFYGWTSGLMGSMVGLAVQYPALCSLPQTTSEEAAAVIIGSCFVAVVFTASIVMLLHSLKG